MTSISYAFRVGIQTVSTIINECCEAIWLLLKNEYLPLPDTNDWINIADGFNEKLQMPNCLGAIDGKHAVIEAPPNSGSTYFNYKHTHSLILIAVCDYRYKFLLVDIGAEGRQSDGGVFRNSVMGQMFFRKQLHFPSERALDKEYTVPFYFVGDEAFPLSDNLMRLYPGHFLEQEKRIFNYRLSRARRTIENSFGILSAVWRIFRRPILASVDTTEKIIKASICLHNVLLNDDFVLSESSEPLPSENFKTIPRMGTNNRIQSAANIRDQLALYFMGNGAVDFQWDK
ncbi:protein ANTAGONIST OF LIKE HETEROCHROMATIN PROTEIN 1-like [Sitophilus oryzae]|uniref:Protein ANTAGONIST OF LIKE HETEROCHROMATIN PROTEIN 1-like n=1 Tax=Sitophilus oryzae TaxID=7048 RepID=A0A6J2YSN2_SITOR|nr:protein ANTAGONIST OF LIKE HETEROCHROMATIN PROTEIN 1-like [Sitophilus oryzae]